MALLKQPRSAAPREYLDGPGCYLDVLDALMVVEPVEELQCRQ
jgi:hypothetical protein